MADDIDEVALNVLLAEGVDPATALAGSLRDNEPRKSPAIFLALVALVAALLWLALK